MKAFIFLTLFSSPLILQANTSFKFHLFGDPQNLDPVNIRGSSGSYLFHNLYRPLFIYSDKKGLVTEGAHKCKWMSSTKYKCELNKTMMWSNGQPVLAQHYVMAFRRIIDPNNKSTHSQHLLNLKNARKIFNSKIKPSMLGVKALGPYQILFELVEADREWPYRLALTALSPIYQLPLPKKPEHLITNGPFKIKKWKRNKKVILEPNPHYFRKNSSKVLVTIYFIEEDLTALHLYQTKRLNFLRQVSTANIPIYKNKKGFFQKPLARFDYIGFNKLLNKQLHLRKALAHSLKYEELSKIYHALGQPGCPSLPLRYLNKIHCYKYDLKKSKQAFAQVKSSFKKKYIYKLGFSEVSGESIKSGMEWVQNQWSKSLGLRVELWPFERGTYIKQLRFHPPHVFRKGIALDRPTCLSALEIFSKNHPENYIKFFDKKYEKILKIMKTTSQKKLYKKLCTEAVDILMSKYALIPQGRIYFSMMEDGLFMGWELNELNQLDLTFLKPK